MTAKQKALTLFIILVVFCTLFIFNQIGEVNANPTHLEPYHAYPAPNTSTPAQTSIATNTPTKTSTGTITRTPTKTSTPIKSPTKTLTGSPTYTPTKSATVTITPSLTNTPQRTFTEKPGLQYADNTIYLPLLSNLITPPVTRSYYIDYLYLLDQSDNVLYHMGCQQGNEAESLSGNQNIIVFLHFGQAFLMDYRHDEGAYLYDGINLPIYDPDNLYDIHYDVHRAALDFARGYSVCSNKDPQKQITIVLSINNYQGKYNTYLDGYSYFHGAAWGDEIYRLQTSLHGIQFLYNPIPCNNTLYYDLTYCDLGTNVNFAAGGDFELGWANPSITLYWLQAYIDKVFITDNTNPSQKIEIGAFFNFGDASGCPNSFPTADVNCYALNASETNTFMWTPDDVWSISNCPICNVLPEIYYDILTKQWIVLSINHYNETNYRFRFTGIFTDYYAFRQKSTLTPNPSSHNDPEHGYGVFHDAITTTTPEVAEKDAYGNYHYRTDICWMDQSWGTDGKTSDFCK